MYSLRRAEQSDADAMAYVHATSWKETYTALLDDHIISKFNVENRKKMWTTFLQNESSTKRAYVVVNSGKIVGIASWHETADHVELLTLYVLAEYQGLGIGKSLFKQAEQDAFAKGKRLITWVLKENPATFFYEKMGLMLIKSEDKKLGDTTVLEVMFGNATA
jgi:ribosomal protein S18 acetylase RimI-like enzyme